MSNSESFDYFDSIARNEQPAQKIDAKCHEKTSISGITTSTIHRVDGRQESTGAAPLTDSGQFTPRINVYENIPFAGGDGDYSILSVLFGSHSIGGGIFGFLTMIDSNKVRGLCEECRQAVMDFPWMDTVSIIKGSVQAWRAAFPVARAVNVSARNDIIDADFVHIRGDARVRLHTVNMSECSNVTDAAFVHLHGIHTLYMRGCNQVTIADAAFVHLPGIHTLDMFNCYQVTITDAAFVHLHGIHALYMSGCNQAAITDAAFVHLRGIHTLYMSGCNQATITDAAFVHLRGIHTLDMSDCNQMTITNAALIHLAGIKSLSTMRCRRDVHIAASNLLGVH